MNEEIEESVAEEKADAQAAEDGQWMKKARITLGVEDVRNIMADTELQKAAATAVQSRAAEMGLVLPSEKAGKLVMSVIIKEKTHAQLQAHGSLAVVGRIRRAAPSDAARSVVLLPSAVPALAPPATSTVLPLAARAAGRSSGFAPVAVPEAPAQPLEPVPAAAVVAAGGGAGVETQKQRRARRQREKRAAESEEVKIARKENRNAKRRKNAGEEGYRGRYQPRNVS